MHKHVLRFALATGVIVAAACVYDAPVTPTGNAITAATTSNSPSLHVTASSPTSGIAARYLIVYKTGSAPSSAISAELRTSGGVLEGAYDQLGFAVVSGVSTAGAARLANVVGVADVVPDVEFTLESAGRAQALRASDAGTESATAPQTAAFFGLQWNMRAIRADAAWAGGALGSSGVSVAILDTGIDYQWPDLSGRVDLSRSVSLRPDEDARLAAAVAAGFFPAFLLPLHPITDLNAHGTLVSSIVASNSRYFAGVTTRTTLFGVKVCTVFNTCSTAAILNGIVYAVDHGADVINMSLGGGFPKNAAPGFVSVINRVFNYADRNGSLIVVAAGNEAIDIDHDGNFYNTFCNSPHAVCVSATGPTAAPTPFGPFINPDAFASYSNFGRSAISVAAPGGTFTTVNGDTTLNAFVTGPCSQTTLAWHQPPPPSPGAPLPPPVIDGPACPRQLGLFLVSAIGTSFSSPHVAGVAASVIASSGRGSPSQVRATLEQSSDDVGASGTDPLYGKGRVNAARAVGAIP
jgi:lantibiotic leader peptide-processing serine protease